MDLCGCNIWQESNTIYLTKFNAIASAPTPCIQPGGICGPYSNQTHRSSMNFTLRTGKYLIEAPQGIQFGIYENEPIEWISKFFGTYKNGDTITLSGQYGRRRLVTKRSYELYIGDPHGAKQGFAVLFHPI